MLCNSAGVCASLQYFEAHPAAGDGGGGGGGGGGGYDPSWTPYIGAAPPELFTLPVRTVPEHPVASHAVVTDSYACGRFGIGCGDNLGAATNTSGSGFNLFHWFVHTAVPFVGNATGISNAINCVRNPSWGQCLEAAEARPDRAGLRIWRSERRIRARR